MVLLAGLQLID